MGVTYTFDVFSSLDGFAAAGGDWTGYWGKQGPELLERRLQVFVPMQRMVLGPKTYRLFEEMFAVSATETGDPWVARMWATPTTVVSTSLEGPLGRPDATIASS